MSPDKDTGTIVNFAGLVLRHEKSLAGKAALTACTIEAGRPAIEASVTFGELGGSIRKLAAGLRAAGFRPGDRIAVAMAVSIPLYALVLAVMAIGATPVLINPGSGPGNTYHSLKTVRLRGIISAKSIGKWRYLLPVLWRVRKLLTLDALQAQALPGGWDRADINVVDPAPGQPALITFTSGSSGRPKGVNRTHDILISQYEALKEHFPPVPGGIDMPAFPVVALYNLCCGVTTILPVVDYKAVDEADPAVLLDQIASFGVTTLSGAPAYLQAITAYCAGKGIIVPGISGLAVGGAPVSTGLARRIREVFPEAEAHILYGSSEAEPIASVTVPEYLAAEGLKHQGYLVGRKAASVQLRIIPVHDGEARVPEGDPPPGMMGEIIVAGKHVCRDYYRNPEADQRHKLRDAAGTLWHRTGDVGFLDDAGRLWLTGRIESIFPIGGRMVYPFPIERVIEGIPGTGRAAVIAAPSGVEFRVYLEHTVLTASLEAEIREAVRQRFDLEIERVVVLERLPVDRRHRSKVDYPELKAGGKPVKIVTISAAMSSEAEPAMDYSILRYSSVWEDIELLYAGLKIGPGDDVLSISSAGDNVLGLLLKGPRSLTAVDASPAQQALLQLKVAAIRELDYPETLSLLGIDNHADPLSLYNRLQHLLPEEAKAFWDGHLGLLQKGVMNQGKLEQYFAAFRQQHLAAIHGADVVRRLLSMDDLAEQQAFFDATWNTPAFEAAFRDYFGEDQMSRTGRDPAQFAYVEEEAGAFFYDRFCHLCRTLPLKGNYYLSRFLAGAYQDRRYMPPCLLEEHYLLLRSLLPRLQIVTADLGSFLATVPENRFSRANLSNVFEYLSPGASEALLRSLHRTFRNGGILAYWNLLVPRSRPDAMGDMLQPLKEEAHTLWLQDRSWFYRDFVLEQVLKEEPANER